MTKNELIFTIINRVKAGGKVDTTKFHPKQVEEVIAIYRSALLKQVPDRELDYYAKQYTASTSTDETTTRKYVSLTVQIENLPRVAKGIVSVSTEEGYDFRFYPTTEREMKLTDGLESNLVTSSKFGYIVGYDRIDFDKAFSSSTIETVRIMAIPTFDEYTSTENVPLGNFEKELIEGVTNFLLGTPEPDLLNN